MRILLYVAANLYSRHSAVAIHDFMSVVEGFRGMSLNKLGKRFNWRILKVSSVAEQGRVMAPRSINHCSQV